MKFFLLAVLVSIGMACESPLKLDKFKNLADEAKLQAPFSDVSYKLDKNFCNRYFFLSDGKYMTFKVNEDKKEHKRSELRFYNEWYVSSKQEKHIKINVKLVKFNKKEFTFLQVHDGYKPLIRIAWYKFLRHKQNHLWAFIRLNELNKPFLKIKIIDLGKMPEDFFDIGIKIKNSKLYVVLNSVNKINGFYVGYWLNPSYFKTGVYLQDTGEAEIYINKLSIKD